MYLLLKALLSGLVIAVASELARRSPLLGAVLISLPMTSILAAIWLYRDTSDTGEVASLSWSILWVIAPSLVFFVVLPLLLQHGIEFLGGARARLRRDGARVRRLALGRDKARRRLLSCSREERRAPARRPGRHPPHRAGA